MPPDKKRGWVTSPDVATTLHKLNELTLRLGRLALAKKMQRDLAVLQAFRKKDDA